MASFTDASGRTWEIRIDLDAIGRLRSAGLFDLNEQALGDLSGFLFGDLEPWLRVAWFLARDPDLSFEGFAAAQNASTLLQARSALAAAIEDFFPEPLGDTSAAKPAAQPDRRGQWLERLGWELAGLCGVDGSKLTLRRLVWMAREHRRFQGELAAWHVSEILKRMPLGAVNLDPRDLNPYRVERVKSEALIALEKWQAEMNWKCRFDPALRKR